MKAYIYTLFGLTLSIISLILFLTLGQIYFIPLIFILPFSGACFSKTDKGRPHYINVESLDNRSQNHMQSYKCPYCGKTIHEQYPTYCPHCGNILNLQNDEYE